MSFKEQLHRRLKKVNGTELVLPTSKKMHYKHLRMLSDQKAEIYFKYYNKLKQQSVIDRDYKAEYALYEMRRKKENKSRKQIRRYFTRHGLVKPNDQKEIHHINGNPLDNSLSNLKILSKKDHICEHNPNAEICKALTSPKPIQRNQTKERTFTETCSLM